jgi:predicted Fe-Mo cluster-binding NifX family protein
MESKLMIAAFTIWNGRIAPVFDVAGQAVLVDDTAAHNVPACIQLPAGSAEEKLHFLHQQQVQVVVCGAMTRYTSRFAQGLGIEVLPFVAGEQQEIITTWLNGNLLDKKFSMPGCGRNCLRNQMDKQAGHPGRMGRMGRRGCGGQQRPVK